MLDLSFVFPCLNEEKTISLSIQEISSVLSLMKLKYEIIVVDNGSIDTSAKIAEKMGARVVKEEKKGYGEALKRGFWEAKGKYIAFADCDGSYPLNFLSEMYDLVQKKEADMVIASRMKGKIEKGAMPFLHRYLGTPILTKIINLLFSGKLSDCNSGFRLIKKESYLKWNCISSGMEFASELLIKALKNKAKIIEVSAGLRCDKRDEKPHLKTWRDGMRHLLFILSEAPKFFESVGFILFLFSFLGELLSIIFGPVQINSVSFLDYHSKLIFLIMMILGVESWTFSASLYVLKTKEKPTKWTQKLIKLKEENLFFFSGMIALSILLSLIWFFLYWKKENFHGIHLINPMLDYSYFVIFSFLFCIGLLQIHILKRVLERK